MPKTFTAVIADDIELTRKVIKEILIHANISVIAEASNGKEAVIQCKTHKPDICIMDVVMPIMGGIEATRKIVEDNKEAKVILLSGLTNQQIMMEAINCGARDFLIKPFTPNDLILSVKKVLQSSEDESSFAVG
jgi:two-component system chemotaxis response regulator CheY